MHDRTDQSAIIYKPIDTLLSPSIPAGGDNVFFSKHLQIKEEEHEPTLLLSCLWTVSTVAIAVLYLLICSRLVLTETVHCFPRFYQTRYRELLNKKSTWSQSSS